MAVSTSGLTILGAGPGVTVVGPDTHVDEVEGLNPACLVIELGAESDLSGFTFENVLFPVNIRHRSRFESCRLNNAGSNYALTILEGDLVEIRNCEFFGPKGIITASSAVTQPQILDCRFEGSELGSSAISIGNGATDAYIARCTFVGYPTAVSTSFGAAITVEDSYFSNQVVAAINLDSGQITMRRCQIDPGIRFPLRVGGGLLECFDSLIGGGTTSTLLTWGNVLMRNCHLLNGGGLTVDFRGPSTAVVDLRSNWWGTTDPQQIGQWIEERYPVTSYEPILPGPVSNETRSLSELKALFGGD